LLVKIGLGVIALEVAGMIVAVAVNWPAQFGEAGTDAGAEALSRGTALSAPLLPLLVIGAAVVLLWRGAVRTGAAVLSLVALVMLVGSLGEAFAPATADTPKVVLVSSGAIGVVLCAVVLTVAVAAWRAANRSRAGEPVPTQA
jgi:hypothetical protein